MAENYAVCREPAREGAPLSLAPGSARGNPRKQDKAAAKAAATTIPRYPSTL